MKKLINSLLAFSLVLSMGACSVNKDNPTPIEPGSTGNSEMGQIANPTGSQGDSPTGSQGDSSTGSQGDSQTGGSEETENSDQDRAELEAIGDVEVVNGLLTVSVTLPASMIGETTQDELDATVKEGNVQAAKLNEDGSVTFKMTKKQHREMLAGLTENIDTTLQELIDDNDTYSISSVTHNDDYTVFEVTLDSDELGLMDSFSVMSMYVFGGMYGIFNGNKADNIVVNFYNSQGNLIESANSADMGD